MKSIRTDPPVHAAEGDDRTCSCRLEAYEHGWGAASHFWRRVRKHDIEYLMLTVLDAERVDRRHGFSLPGDSALAVFLNSIEESVTLAVLDGLSGFLAPMGNQSGQTPGGKP